MRAAEGVFSPQDKESLKQTWELEAAAWLGELWKHTLRVKQNPAGEEADICTVALLLLILPKQWKECAKWL